MGFLENLVTLRIQQVLSEISVHFSELIKASPYETLDTARFVYAGELLFTVEFNDGSSLVILEKYSLMHYALKITLYNYIYLDSSNNPIVSYDNSPHHPEISSFPHHKHYYPKRKFRPLPFSGDLLDALSEIKWIMTNSGGYS